jgi:hypothetical protein
MKTKRFELVMDEETKQKLAELAERVGVSRADVVRTLVDQVVVDEFLRVSQLRFGEVRKNQTDQEQPR